MDGLECSEKTYQTTIINKDFRIDSAFYTTKIYRNPSLKYEPIGNHLVDSQYGVSIEMNEDCDGYPIFRMNEIHNMLSDLDVAKCAKLSVYEFSKFRLNDGDVLFNRTNSYEWVGRTGIYYNTGIAQTYASYLIRIVPDMDSILPEYLTAFLSSRYGIADIKRRARQSINQTNVNLEEVKQILIPLLSKKLQQYLRMCFVSAHKKRLAARKLFIQATQYVDQKLVSSNSIAFNQTVSVRNFHDSFGLTGRLDAEYYQLKYDEYKKQLRTTETVESLCKIYDKSYLPRDEINYKYIELANVGTVGDINDVEIILGSELPTRARRKVKTGQVIVSSVEGSLQSCALITDEYNNALCSTGFYVLDSGSFNSETLLILFKSEPIHMLMKQRCSGTILTAITKEELLKMPLPKIDEITQKEIALKVQESFTLRHKSEQLLESAKKAVETAIEQSEEKAIAFLKENGVEV